MDRPQAPAPPPDDGAPKEPSQNRFKRKASQGAPPASHERPSPPTRTTALPPQLSDQYRSHASSGASNPLSVPTAAAFRAVPSGGSGSNRSLLSFHSPVPVSRNPMRTPAPSTSEQAYQPASAAAAAQDAIASLRWRQELNRLEQERSIRALINWGNSSSHTNSFGVHERYPWHVPSDRNAAPALLPSAWGLLPGEYYHSGALAALLGPDPVTSLRLVREMNQLRDMDALLWHRELYAATARATSIAPQLSVTGLRALDPGQHDPPTITYLSGGAGIAARAPHRGAAPRTRPGFDPRDGRTAAASAASAPVAPVPIPSSSSNATSHDTGAAEGAAASAFGAVNGPESSSAFSSSSSRSVPETPDNGKKVKRRRVGAVAQAAGDKNAPGEAASSGRVIPMARDADAVHSSKYQCLLREQIEYFEADNDALHAKAQGRNMPIQLRQVGIRCVHCARRTPATTPREGAVSDGEIAARMVRGAVYYPTKLDNLYQAVQNMANNHFVNRKCPSAPSSLLDEIVEAKRTRPKRSGGRGRRYFGQSAERAGIIDAPDGSGLFFSAAAVDYAATEAGAAINSAGASPLRPDKD
jgi:hypothetical protein